MQTKICVLSAPPKLRWKKKFFNKACCFLPDLGICDFIHLPEKGLSAMTLLHGGNFLREFCKEIGGQGGCY